MFRDYIFTDFLSSEIGKHNSVSSQECVGNIYIPNSSIPYGEKDPNTIDWFTKLLKVIYGIRLLEYVVVACHFETK